MLEVAQTIFYFVVSFAILAIGVLLVMVIYHMLAVMKDVHKLSDDFTKTYDRTKRAFKKIISKFGK